MAMQPLVPNVNDFGQFAQMRSAARNNDPNALHEAARQFEALFTQQLLKSAREARIGDDMMGSQQTEFYQGMFDQQMAQKLSEGRGLGIADLLVRQLQGKQAATAPAAALKAYLPSMMPLVENPPVAKSLSMDKVVAAPGAPSSSIGFVSRMLPHAEAAARELGIPARALVAQAALETGWGKHQIKNQDGTPSYNFFGIKADASWKGPSVSKTTVEYEAGTPRTERAQFRSYASPEAAFSDYVRFLKTQPRYAKALDHGGDMTHFVHGLQKAGYATDPTYADKISRIASGRLMTLALASSTNTRSATV